MLTLCASALVFSILPYRLAAQFAAYPVCVQPLLNRNFPPSCLSLSLVDQNTCLCQDANAFGSTLVKAVNQECGCADLQETAQLTEAYCNQVGVDIGPAFDVFIQDNTPCGGGDGGSGGGPSISATLGSGGSGGGGATSTGSGGSTVTVSVGGGGTSTTAGGGASTGSAGGGGNTAGSTTKSSGANERLAVEQIVGIVIIGVAGGMLALR